MRLANIERDLYKHVWTGNHHQFKHLCGIAALLLSCCLAIFYWSPRPHFSAAEFWLPYVCIVLLTIPSLCSLLFWYWATLRDRSGHPDHLYDKLTSPNKEWSANWRNTTWTAAITAIVVPILVLCVWRSDLQAIQVVVQKDEVVSRPLWSTLIIAHIE